MLKSRRGLFSNTPMQSVSFWNENLKLPVYLNYMERITTEMAADIILDENFDESMLCEMRVDKNALFVVDISKLRNHKDIGCDDMGSWRANGTHPTLLYVDRKGAVNVLSKKKATRDKFSGSQYKLIKRYYFHKTATDLNKTIFLMQGM